MTDPGTWISCQRWRSSHPTDGQSVLSLRSGQRRRTEHLSASRPTPYAVRDGHLLEDVLGRTIPDRANRRLVGVEVRQVALVGSVDTEPFQ